MRFLFVLFVLLNLADLGGTLWWLGPNGEGELNPIAILVWVRLGPAGLVAFKTGCVLIVLGVCMWLRELSCKLAARTLAFGCGVYAQVCVTNLCIVLSSLR